MKTSDFFKELNELDFIFMARPDKTGLFFEIAPSMNTDKKYTAFTSFKDLESGNYNLDACIEDIFDTFIEWIKEEEGEL